MDLDLTGRRALVTGSSSGIGEAIARRLALEGAAVVVHGRASDRVHAVAEEIRESGGSAVAVVRALDDPAQVPQVARDAARLLGGEIDILVNNAGGRHRRVTAGWHDIGPADWAGTYQTNVIACVQLILEVLPGMRSRNWGRIIQIGSADAIKPFPDTPDYGASKAALANMTVSLSLELEGTGVTANCISPGPIATPGILRDVREWGTAQGLTDFAEMERAATTVRYPCSVRRLGRTDEIAATAALLASPLGGFYSGANIHLDGGRTGVVT